MQKEQSFLDIFQEVAGQFLAIKNIGFAGSLEERTDHADMKKPLGGFFGKKEDAGLVQIESVIFIVARAEIEKKIRLYRLWG